MRPRLELLTPSLLDRVLEEAFQLLRQPGIKVQSSRARRLLAEAGAQVEESTEVVRIPESVARQALETVPRRFALYNRAGEPAVQYGGDAVHFDPGSSGVSVLDPETRSHRPSRGEDLIRLVKIAEQLPEYDAQSTAVICSEVPKEIGDLYRLYLVLLYSTKPVVTGAFSTHTTGYMFEMLAIEAGSVDAMAARPRAIFDVCPSPPLIWSEFGAENLMDLAEARVPAQIVSMPLAGAAAPVTLIGAVVQHAAECLSGMVIHQLAGPGAPVVWGGAPAIFDMRQGTTPMGAMETAMIDAAYAQVGKALGFPTHAYLGASDAKLVDAQAGLETGITALIGALAGINMISGAGMLDFLACQSPEKLVIDAEAIRMARRLEAGIAVRTETLAVDMFADFAFRGDFLKQRVTRELYAKEQALPSRVIDRGSLRAWLDQGGPDMYDRAILQVQELVGKYVQPEFPARQKAALHSLVSGLARGAGMDTLPEY